MVVVVPAVLLFGAVMFILIRSRMLRPLEAVISVLFGFFLASTGLGAAVGAVLLSFFHLGGTPAPARQDPAPTTVVTTPVPTPVVTSTHNGGTGVVA